MTEQQFAKLLEQFHLVNQQLAEILKLMIEHRRASKS